MIPMVAALSLGAGQSIIYDLSSLASSYTDESSATTSYSVEIIFRATTDATVDVIRLVQADLLNEEVYLFPQDSTTLYIRCTQNSGSALNIGDTTGVWNTLTSAQARSFGLSYTSSGGNDQIVANLDFDIATDSGGANIVASKAGLDIIVGETF